MLTSQYLAETKSLQCLEIIGGEPITVEEAKMFLRVDNDDEDTVIENFIAAARAQVENKTHRVIRFSTWEWKVSGLSGVCQVPLTPCAACDGIFVDGQEVDKALYTFQCGDMSPLFGTITTLDGFPEGEAIVTLKAGYVDGEIPPDIIRWMQVRLGDFYEQRESFAVGVHFFEFSRNFVDSLLDPYLIVSI